MTAGQMKQINAPMVAPVNAKTNSTGKQDRTMMRIGSLPAGSYQNIGVGLMLGKYRAYTGWI